jgi:hypothetical protein
MQIGGARIFPYNTAKKFNKPGLGARDKPTIETSRVIDKNLGQQMVSLPVTSAKSETKSFAKVMFQKLRRKNKTPFFL